MATNYQRGANFERRVQADMENRGYVTVRSAGSHSPADVVALMAGEVPVAIQCKLNGRLDPEEWNEFLSWSNRGGMVAVLARPPSNRRGIEYMRLTALKKAKGRQPMEAWKPRERQRHGV